MQSRADYAKLPRSKLSVNEDCSKYLQVWTVHVLVLFTKHFKNKLQCAELSSLSKLTEMHAIEDPIGWADDGPGMLSTSDEDCLSMFDLEQSADLMTVS